MNFLAALVVKILEALISYIMKIIKKDLDRRKEIQDDNSAAKSNADKIDQAQSHDEKVKAGEDLLNGKS